jgi:hypothetical protein
MRKARLVGILAALLVPSVGSAQGTLTKQCGFRPQDRMEFCERVGQAVDILRPRLAVVFAGGNPVPGTASTLGMRLGTMPRISVAARTTMIPVSMPPFRRVESTDDVEFIARSFNVDGSVGLFSGLSIFPTIGGVGSVDVILSAGISPVPAEPGLKPATKPGSWAAGARVGIIRESFTAPGISVSGVYRKVGDVVYGDSTDAFIGSFDRLTDAYIRIEDMSVMSFRAAIGKRIPAIGVGATAGAGLDRYASTIRYGAANSAGTVPDTKSDRKSAFVNASWTFILVNVTGELGWQQGGKDPNDPHISTDKLKKAGYFGGIALRIAL